MLAMTLMLFALEAAPVHDELLAIVCQDICSGSSERVPDTALAQMRGGVRLPNGLNVAIGIDIQTRVDGVLVLHTVYVSDGPNAGVRVFTDGRDAPSTAPTTTTVSTSTTGVPIVIVDRSPGGTTISPGKSSPATTINLVNGGPDTWLNGDGQTQVPVTANGPSIAAAPGDIRLETGATGASVILVSPTLEVRQLIGSATGIVVANTADGRAIDTVSSINVDLQGLSPQLFAGAFTAQRIALETMLVHAPGGF